MNTLISRVCEAVGRTRGPGRGDLGGPEKPAPRLSQQKRRKSLGLITCVCTHVIHVQTICMIVCIGGRILDPRNLAGNIITVWALI